ncbi:GNAT family N-acetyltransferase [Nanoarchaeota archaeon]
MKLKKGKVEVRYQRISDAKRFYEILKNPNFKHFGAKPKSVKEEKKFLEKTQKKRRDNIEHNFTITFGGKLVGGAGIKIDQQRKFIGEIGYFIDEAYWGKGIATVAVKLIEKYGFKDLKLKRIELVMVPENKASERVAIKVGYEKEGLMKKSIEQQGKYKDTYLYAKVK